MFLDPTTPIKIMYTSTASAGALGLALGGLIAWRRSLRQGRAFLALVLGLAAGICIGYILAMSVIVTA